MSIRVNDFQWIPGKNDAEYIKLLESSRDEWQKIAQKAIAKLKTLSRAQEPVEPVKANGSSGYWCRCGWYLGIRFSGINGSVQYCANCGRKVKWE